MKLVDTICRSCNMEQTHLVYNNASNGDVVNEYCEHCEEMTDQTVTREE